jgi:peptidoglycan/LPS O-acetylase OafA/YrhL
VKRLYLNLDETPSGMSNIPGLDGVRAISILMAMLTHSGLRFVPGVLALTVFFFLSGFLITTLLLDEYGRRGTINIPQFYMRRFLRLFPPLLLYIVTAIAVLLFLDKGVDLTGVTGALFYFANYLYAFQTHHLDDLGVHLWSLSMEEHFYLFFPPLLFLLLRRKVNPVVTLAMLCIIPLILRLAVASATSPLFYMQYNTAATELRFDSILFGCLTAIAIRRPRGASFVGLATHRATALCAGALLLAAEFFPNQFFRHTLRFTLQNVALISLVLTAVYTPHFIAAKRLLNSALMRWIAVLSYSLYLWHLGVFELMRNLAGSVPPLLIHVLGWITTFAIALAVHFAVERPVVRLRKRFGSHGHEEARLFARELQSPAGFDSRYGPR